jgi:flagellar M-ring protein FliF
MIRNLREIWQRMTNVQRVALVGVAGAFLVAAGLLVGWARTPKMSLLYSDLPAEEAAQIVQEIEDQGVTYELRGNGTAIYVPSDNVHSVRLTMASKGLPSGGGMGGGYKILDNSDFGANPAKQRINFIRALEGELARSISMVDAVKTARVHVVKPQTTLFGGKDKKPTASVVVTPRPGRRLDGGNIDAIVHMVASSVEGLDPADVSVIDSKGSLLSGKKQDASAGQANTVLDLQSRWEKYYVAKIENLLMRMLGPNRFAARVDVRLDMSRIEEIEEVAVGEKIPIKEKEEMKSSSTPVTTGGEEEGGAGPASGNTRESRIEITYDQPKKHIKKVKAAGEPISKHVAVVVDLSPLSEGEEAPEGADAAAVAAAAGAGGMPSLEKVRNLLAKAVGLDEESGDTIEVVDQTFHGPATDAMGMVEEPSTDVAQLYLEIARRSSLAVLVLGALLALRIFRGPKKKRKGEDVEVSDASPLLAADEKKTDLESMRERVAIAMEENPEQVKQMFLSWVQEGEGE